MRNIPRVLSVHMSMAASYWHEGVAKHEFSAAEIYGDMEDMMRGIQLYMAHPYQRNLEALESAYETGQVQLLKPAGCNYEANAPVVLLVPSLINRSYIFDLTQKRSMLRWLVEQGVAAYLLDWNEICDDVDIQNLSDVVAKKIAPCAAFLKEQHCKKIHVLGYCMGGTLVFGAAVFKPDFFHSVISMAAPWNFHGGSQALLKRIQFWAPTLLPQLKDKGVMDVDWLQMLFASLDPSIAAQKFKFFAEEDPDSRKAEIFVAVEDWLNDGVELPEGVVFEAIQDWFFENKPHQGLWDIEDTAIDVSKLDIPAFVLASSKDRLVEYETASALAEQLPHAKLHDPACGHIGMIASSRAIDDVWQPILDWVFEHDE